MWRHHHPPAEESSTHVAAGEFVNRPKQYSTFDCKRYFLFRQWAKQGPCASVGCLQWAPLACVQTEFTMYPAGVRPPHLCSGASALSVLYDAKCPRAAFIVQLLGLCSCVQQHTPGLARDRRCTEAKIERKSISDEATKQRTITSASNVSTDGRLERPTPRQAR